MEQVADLAKKLEDREREKAEREDAQRNAEVTRQQLAPRQQDRPRQPSRTAPAIPLRVQKTRVDSPNGSQHGPVQVAVHEEVRERLEAEIEVKADL